MKRALLTENFNCFFTLKDANYTSFSWFEKKLHLFHCVLMPQCASLICLWPNNDWSENNLIYIKNKFSRVIRIDPFSWHKRPTSFLCWNFCFKVQFLAWCWSNNLHELFIFFADDVYLIFLKSDNLQYNTLGWWDDRLIDQASDVSSIIFFIISCKILCKNQFIFFITLQK